MNLDKTAFTCVFKGDVGKFGGNPLKTETPFGVPCSVGRGDAFAREDQLEERLAVAYQIVGALADATDTFNHPEIQRALDFLAYEEVAADEFGPWPQSKIIPGQDPPDQS